MRHNEYRLSFRDTPKEMKRLAGGVILGEWRDAVDGFLNGVESEEWRGYDKRFRLLSGHDTTLANMLGNLELLSGTQFVQPGYRSQLIFEIWKPVAAVSDSSEPMVCLFCILSDEPLLTIFNTAPNYLQLQGPQNPVLRVQGDVRVEPRHGVFRANSS